MVWRQRQLSMGWSVHADRRHRLSYVRLCGLVTYADVKDAQHALAIKVSFDPAFPLLIDLRHVDELRLSAKDIYAVVTVTPVASSTRRAILVDTLPVFGTARLYAMLREDLTGTDLVRVCHTPEAATEWLGVDIVGVIR